MKISIMVDFDNQRPSEILNRIGRGLKPNLADYVNGLRIMRERIVDHVIHTTSEFVEANIRLYGGWTYTIDGQLTDSGEMLSQAFQQIGPTSRTRSVRTKLFLVNGILALPNATLNRTFRTQPWRGERLNFQEPFAHGCAAVGDTCAHFDGLREWIRKGRCSNRSNCRVRMEACVSKDSQKMVDSMIVADAISASVSDFDSVVVISMDDDILPGVLAASVNSRQISLVRFGMRNVPGDYDHLLARAGVGVFDYAEL